MKKLKKYLFTFLLIGLSSQCTFANEVHLESEMQRAKNQMRILTAQLQVGREVVVDSTVLKQLYQEVVVKHVESSSSHNSKANFSIGGLANLSREDSSSRHESYDVTKILQVNPDEVALFDATTARDFAGLQEKIRAYIQTHAAQLVELKEWSIYYASLVGMAINQGLDVDFPGALAELANANELHFLGRQFVVKCISTKYVDHGSSWSSRSSSQGNASFFFISASASKSSSASYSERNYAHVESECRSMGENVTALDAGTVKVTVDFHRLDLELNHWIAKLEKVRLSSDAPEIYMLESPYFRTVDLP